MAVARVPALSSVLTPASATGLSSPPGISRCVLLSTRCHCYVRPRLPLLESATRLPVASLDPCRVHSVLGGKLLAQDTATHYFYPILADCSHFLPSHDFQPEDQPSLPLVPRMRVVRGRRVRGGAWSCLVLPHQDEEMRERRAGVGMGPGRAGQAPSASCHWAPALGSLHGCPWQHHLGPSFQITSSLWAEDSTCLHRCLTSAFSCWATCSHSVTPIWFFTRTFGSNFSSSHCRVSVFPAALLDCSLPLPESGILLGQQRVSGVGGSCGSPGQLVKPPNPTPHFLPSPGNMVSAAAQLGSSCVCTHGPPFPSPPRPGYPAAWPGVLFGRLENLTAAANSPRQVPRPPLTTRHSETLLKIFSCALRLLHLQKLENVLRDLPPWPALKRLLLLLAALRNAIAQNLHFIQGELAWSYLSATF